MGRIYGEADCVITWLGPVPPEEDERVRDLFTRMNRMIGQLKYRAAFLRQKQHATPLEPMHVRIDHRFSLRVGIDFLDYITPKSYWTRTWIVQEVVKASHLAIRCGTYEVGKQSLEMIQENQPLDPDPFLSLGSCFPAFYVPMQLFEQRRLLPGACKLWRRVIGESTLYYEVIDCSRSSRQNFRPL
jgi:hypothetical protein